MARPVTWTDDKKKESIEKIFERISEGESVRSILDKGDRKIYPSWVTFNEWLNSDDTLSKQYARVCKLRADKIFEEMIDIADNQESDVITIDDKEIVNHNVINRARLRIDTRKWILSKMNPKKYGDKLEVEQTTKRDLSDLTIDELKERAKTLKDIE